MKSWTLAAGVTAIAGVALLAFAGEKPAAQPAAAAATAPAPGNAAAKPSPFKTPREVVSYGIGMSIGQQASQSGIDVDPDALVQGFRDALAGHEPKVSEAQFRAAMQSVQQEVMAKQMAKAKADGEKNKTEGEKFLADNAKKPGVKTTASGLQYEVIKEGTGPTPKASDTVKVNYKGTLLSGKEFDSSYKRGEPAVFPVDGVIKGWTEALQLMKVGAKYRLVIPASLAYGERGAGNVIGPNSTLVFEVELLGIEPANADPHNLGGHPSTEPATK
jgi:FKBP-type peptidyl-prolyl cis-trans isomerase FklB